MSRPQLAGRLKSMKDPSDPIRNRTSSVSTNCATALEGGWNVGLPPLLGHSAQLAGQNCQIYTPAPKISEYIPSLLRVDKRKSSLEKFQEPYEESNPEPLYCGLNKLHHRLPLFKGQRSSFLRGKRQGREDGHSPPSSAEVKI